MYIKTHETFRYTSNVLNLSNKAPGVGSGQMQGAALFMGETNYPKIMLRFQGCRLKGNGEPHQHSTIYTRGDAFLILKPILYHKETLNFHGENSTFNTGFVFYRV